MTLHKLEVWLMGLFVVVSVGCAVFGAWQPAQYWLLAAAFVDFDDWSHK